MRNGAVKKALSLILALCLMLTLAPFVASAEETPLGASGEILESGDLPISDETPVSPTDLTETLRQGGMMPQAIDPDHTFVVGDDSYVTLAEAVDAVPSGGTIKVQKDAITGNNVSDTLKIEKDITFDLSEGNLRIKRSGGLTLEVKNCTVSTTGSGYLDVVGGVGIQTDAATITVRNVTGHQGRGAYALNGGEIHVTGDATGATEAVCAFGEDSVVTVAGSAISTGSGATSIGAKAQDLGLVEITGDTTGAGYGVYAISYATITVGGDVTATGSNGAAAFATDNSTVTINGTVTGNPFVMVDGTGKGPAEFVTVSSLAGYCEYNNGSNSKVWIKATCAPTQLATPTGLAWDTATEDSIKAKWDTVAGAQGYTIMLYKNGAPVGSLGTSATSLHLTQYIQNSGTGSFTFTVRALAPNGSADYTDSATSPQSPAYSYTAPAAVPAEGNARAILYTKSIFVRLSQGGFKAVQDKVYWTLGGNGASGNSIVGVTLIDSTEVQITLTNDINTLDVLTITAAQGAFADGTAPFVEPLSVRLDNPQTYVCTIDGVAYSSLKSALDFALASTVDNKTIVLAADITYTDPVVVEKKTLTFYLNGKNLFIDTSGTITGDWLTASSLKVDNGSVNYTGEGKFTVCGERCGVEAINGGRARVSEILIKNPGLPYPNHYYVYGAHAQNENNESEGSQITVTGGIKTLNGNPCDYAIGALAGQDSTVTVGGDISIEGESVIGLSAGSMNDGNGTATVQNITVTGESTTGVKAAGESIATVNGAVTAAGAYAVGVSAELAENGSGGTVIIKGDAAATGTNSTGVACFSSASAAEKSTVTVDGTVSGENYLSIDNVLREKDAKDSVSGGYWIYNGQYGSVVKAKDPDGGTPGGNVPTAPQTLTATPGNGRMTLSWTAPSSSGDSAVTGYQVSSDGGASWTNVGLTTCYTFMNLTNETEYTFKVRAVSDAGSGAEASRAATPTAAPSVPSVPRNFTASPGFERVILNWDAPMSNGGSSITRYEVSKNNGGDWTSAGLYTSYEFTGLTNGMEYTFKLRAVNGAGNGAEASASAMPSDSAQTSFTVNFYSNGALYTSRSVINGSVLGGSWPTNPTQSNYIFSGWFTGQNGAGMRYTYSSVITADVDLYANWNYSGGSGDGSSSSSNGPNVTILSDKKPDQPVIAGFSATPTVNSSGHATVTISQQSLEDAIAKALANAKAQGKTANGIGVSLDVKMPKGASSLNLTLSQSALQSLVNGNVQSLEIGGGIASLNLDLETLGEIQKQSAGNVIITIKPVKNLSAAAKKLIGTRPVYDVTVSYVKYGKTVTITSLGKGSAILSIPYAPNRNEAIGWLFGVYVDGNGQATRIPDSAYDANSRSIILSGNHFSIYGVGYTSPAEKYADIATHWAKEGIDYVVGRGLFSGTTDTSFSPDTAMDLKMLVTVLGKLVGADVSAYKTSIFTDVAAGKYYLPYVEWAYKKGIISGTGNGKFAPERAVTREEIALILQNYAKATGYTLPVTCEAITFADNSSIASAYANAIRSMQQTGIMVGGSGNKFNPKAGATRAEVASMLHRYVKLTLDPATAQGWALNDDGRYLYYKDSKPITGWQTIDGVKYYFYSTGILQTGWVKDGNNWRYYSGNKALTGWWYIGSGTSKKRYYFDVNAVMVSGKWLQIDSKWYYFYTDGSLSRSTTIDGYEVDENGIRKTK